MNFRLNISVKPVIICTSLKRKIRVEQSNLLVLKTVNFMLKVSNINIEEIKYSINSFKL